MSTNAVFLMGNLTRDPELRYTKNGTAVTKLGMAVNERYKRGEDWEERAHFFNITVWAKQAESCAEHLRKGSGVLVEGSLQWSSWEAPDGTKRSAVDVRAKNVRFLNRPPRQTDGDVGVDINTTVVTASEDDIPF